MAFFATLRTCTDHIDSYSLQEHDVQPHVVLEPTNKMHVHNYKTIQHAAFDAPAALQLQASSCQLQTDAQTSKSQTPEDSKPHKPQPGTNKEKNLNKVDLDGPLGHLPGDDVPRDGHAPKV